MRKIASIHDKFIRSKLSNIEIAKSFLEHHLPAAIRDKVDFKTLKHCPGSFIEPELKKSFAGETVVVSHHMPTFLNYPPKFKGDVLNEAFAVELTDLIELSNPDYWIFGHLHGDIPVFEIGSTKLLTNQLGYVKYNEHTAFSTIVSIDLRKNTD